MLTDIDLVQKEVHGDTELKFTQRCDRLLASLSQYKCEITAVLRLGGTHPRSVLPLRENEVWI